MLTPINTIEFRQLLADNPLTNNLPDISTPAQWLRKRERLQRVLKELMGEASSMIIPDPEYSVLEEMDGEDYRRLKIAYWVEPGEEVRAYLLLPHRPNGAAVLCLHGTSDAAKDSLILPGPGRRDWANFLAMHGFITLAPDHICSGERLASGQTPYDTRSFYDRHPHWSAAGKALWDGERALDILQTVEGVDVQRIGCIGHSLGAHGTTWLAAFDERVAAAVASCGNTTWQDNAERYHWSREEWYVYFPKLRAIFQEQEKSGGLLPVEVHEYAALIAPRPFLNISGLTDATYGNNETMPAVTLQLAALWDLLGQPEKFAQLLMGAPHDVPYYSRLLALGWLEKWLSVEGV